MKALLIGSLFITLLIWGVLGFGPSGDCSWPNCSRGGGTPGVPCARFYIENPAVELFETVAYFDQDVTISRIVCQCRGGTDIDFIWKDDGDAIEPEQACPTSGGLDDTDIDSPDIAAGSAIDLDITAVDGGVTDCTVLMFCE